MRRGDSFGQQQGLIITSFPQTDRVQRHRNDAVKLLNIQVISLHKFCDAAGEWLAKSCFLIILELDDKITQGVLVQAGGPGKIKLVGLIAALQAARKGAVAEMP